MGCFLPQAKIKASYSSFSSYIFVYPGFCLSLSLSPYRFLSLFLSPLPSTTAQTYSTASTINNTYDGELKMHAFDSQIAAYSQHKLTEVACKMAADGKSVEEIIAELTKMRPTQNALFLVDDLTGLIKNGRLKGAQAFAGKMLKIKPILSLCGESGNPRGEIHPYAKIRTTKKAVKELVANFISLIEKKDVKTIAFTYAKKTETYDLIIDQIRELKPEYVSKIVDFKIANVVVAHVGTQLYALQHIEYDE